MSKHLCFAFLVVFSAQQAALALELPLHPSEAEVVKAIVATEQLHVESA